MNQKSNLFPKNTSVLRVHYNPAHLVRFCEWATGFRYDQLRITAKSNLSRGLKERGGMQGVPGVSCIAEVSRPQGFLC
jgi:hypothetical protein